MHIFVSFIPDPPSITNVFKRDKNGLMHYEILTRILFIYAKLNPGIRYVQGIFNYKGMNEILAPLYYVLLQNRVPIKKYCYEWESFFSFTLLMTDIKDNFIKSLDNSETGIKARI
jgi:hypothetical protein